MERSLEFLMKNILFIAPHPDDELVGATFIIKEDFIKKKSYYFFSNKWCSLKRRNVVLG